MANLITQLSREHKFVSEVSLKHIIYLYLISISVTEDSVLYSKVDLSDLQYKFTNLESEEIENAVTVLEAEGLLSVKDDRICLGTHHDGIKKLYNGKTKNPNTFFDKLQNSYDLFAEAMKDSNKFYEVERRQERIDKLRKKEASRWVHADFMDLFRVSYECVYQEFMGDFQVKDTASMRNMIRYYDTSTLIRMVIQYIHFTDSFHKKSLPSIPLLIYHKNAIHTQVSGNEKRESVRHTRIESDF